jgi:putative acetyltransferase
MPDTSPPLIRPTGPGDADAIYELYRAVAAQPGGLARHQDEITRDYVTDFLSRAEDHGLSLVAVTVAEGVIGEIHAFSRPLRAFAHVLGDLTVAVHPQAQARGAGRALFSRFLADVQARFEQVLRVELLARESNAHAIRFYESLGFRREGRLDARVRGVSGALEADIPMAWLRAAPTR